MKIFSMSVFESWPIEDKTIQLIAASPPYYSLRKYSIPEIIIGGDKDCKHEFEMKYMELGHENRQGKGSKTLNASAESHIGVHGKKVGKQGFCIHCNAWQGQHGLEPDYKLYLSHCNLWMQEAIRVLRDDGVIFINLGDSFNNQSAKVGRQDKSKYGGKSGLHCLRGGNANYPNKSKLLIPERFAIMCVDELGLILRNHIVWFKPNGMPESCQDRFSKKWESIFMFTKSTNTQYWKHEETNQWVREKPEPDYIWTNNKTGDKTKIEPMDWKESVFEKEFSSDANIGENNKEPYKTNNPHTMRLTKISQEESESFGSPRGRYHREKKLWSRINLWQGYDYYFDLDAIREFHKQVSLDRLKRAISNNNKWVSGADGQSPMGLSQPRPNIKYIKTGNQKGKKQQQGEKEFGVYRPYTERKLRIDGKNPGDVWSIPTQPSPEKHFAMWPEVLVKRMILCSTKPGDIVLDPFCGSGTTLRVADELNRIGKGIDLGYQDIQGRRLQNIQKELI